MLQMINYNLIYFYCKYYKADDNEERMNERRSKMKQRERQRVNKREEYLKKQQWGNGSY